MLDRFTFDRELEKLDAFAGSGYFLALHIRFSSPLFFFHTYDPDWLSHYTENGYVLRDPVIAWAFGTTGSSRWSDMDIPDPFGILEEAKDYGLVYGMTVSCGPLSSRSVGTLARSDREFTQDEIDATAKVVMRLHELSVPTVALTDAQREALKCVASGMRHAEAASSLGISESALKLRLASARERLMARTTAEAIQRAKDNRII